MNKDLLGGFAESLRESADEEVAKAKSNLCDFARYVMRDPRGRPFELQPFHIKMLNALETDRFVLIESFRGSGKSQLISICYPLWLIMKNRDVRIMILTAADALSKEWLRQIEQIMSSPHYNKLVGDIIPSGRDGLVWTNDTKVVRGRTSAASGSTIVARGVHGSIRGLRNDVVIGDDMVSEANSHTPYQRDVLDHFFHSAVLPTLDHYPDRPMSGQCVVVGTPLYDSDLMSKLKSEWSDDEEAA